MAIYRVRRACSLGIPPQGRPADPDNPDDLVYVDLREDQALDSDNPLDAAIIAAHPTQVRRDQVIEAATAAPGELRDTSPREVEV